MSRKYFNLRYSERLGAPQDIKFVVYSKEAWSACVEVLSKATKIIDLGVGGGTLISNVSKITNAELIGIDQSKVALELISEKYPFVKTVHADVLSTQQENSSVDTVLSTMTIEHVDDVAMLKEVNRILEPGGCFFVTTVVKKKRAFYFYKNEQGERVLEPSHLKEYASEKQFLELLEENGFVLLCSELSQIKFPIIDPFLKLISKLFGINYLIENPLIEKIRLISRVPIIGYYAIEVLCQKPTQ